MIYVSDGGLNPPHFYITHEEAQRALLHYTGMTEHPNMPAIDRNRLNPDIPPPVNAMRPPVLPAPSAPS
jgi:hypothetical protein